MVGCRCILSVDLGVRTLSKFGVYDKVSIQCSEIGKVVNGQLAVRSKEPAITSGCVSAEA